MTRRQRTDSVSAAVSAHTSSRSAFEWPNEWQLPEDKAKVQRILTTADNIWHSRAPRDWRPSDSTLIAEFAIVSADLAGIQTTLTECNYLHEKEGKSGMVLMRHPLMDAAQHLTTRRMSLARALALTGAQVDTRTVANAARQMLDAEQTGEITNDGLLAN